MAYVYSTHDCSKCFILYFPDKPIQSNTTSTSLESIQPRYNYCWKALCTNIPIKIFCCVHNVFVVDWSFVRASQGLQIAKLKHYSVYKHNNEPRLLATFLLNSLGSHHQIPFGIKFFLILTHFTHIYKYCFYHTRDIYRIQLYLSLSRVKPISVGSN